MGTSPPAYAWDWFGRQRLLWHYARLSLIADNQPSAVIMRYSPTDARNETLKLLREDYPSSPQVKAAVDNTISERMFLGRLHLPLADHGFHNAPRGLRWWWTALTGEQLTDATPPAIATQLALGFEAASYAHQKDIYEGYGDE
ncbi:MAG: hypothetical protein WD360_07195, partial [Nitriliruptoraceae bacterium]